MVNSSRISATIGKGELLNRDQVTTGTGTSFVYAILCDGVSHCSKGGEASNLAISMLTATLNTLNQLITSAILDQSIMHIHNALVEKYAGGGLSTLTLSVCLNNNTYIVKNIGDSPCYKLNEHNIAELITLRDDHSSRPMMLNGKTIIQNGMTVMQVGLMQTIGQLTSHKKLFIHTYEGEYQSGDCFLLLSDGVDPVDAINFTKKFRYKENYQEKLDDFVIQASKKSKDDASFALIRMGYPISLQQAIDQIDDVLQFTLEDEKAWLITVKHFHFFNEKVKALLSLAIINTIEADSSNKLKLQDWLVELSQHLSPEFNKVELDKLINLTVQNKLNKLARKLIGLIASKT